MLKPKVPFRRIVFHEITREAIERALATPRDIDTDLVRAQEGRRILDRLFGYTLSPVLWRKVQSGLSAGRVQSVAVRLIVEREEERRAFVTSTYWDLEAEFGGPTGNFKAALASLGGKRIASGKDFDSRDRKAGQQQAARALDEKQCGPDRGRCAYLEQALDGEGHRAIGGDKPATSAPTPPFTTSTLQQEANRKLGYGAKRTMQIAQKLYEGVDIGESERVGVITYMRTDSVTLSDKALRDSQAVIRDLYGKDYAQGPRPYKTKQRNAQEAHEAIRPTEVSRRPADLKPYLDKEELALYELIWKRTIASQMPDAQLLRTVADIAATNAKGVEAIFTASGKKINFPGFLRAYVEGSDDPNAELGDQEVVLPDLKVGQLINARAKANAAKDVYLDRLTNKRHDTVPPARYTEASLVKKLEEESIGRPSTYASIISTIQDRGYIYVNKSRQLIPTFTAIAVTNLLRKHFSDYVDIKFTARMEEELDQIAEGKMTWLDHVKAFYRGTKSEPGLERIVSSKSESIEFPTIPLGTDPKTGEPVEVRIGRNGPYLMRGVNGNATTAPIPDAVAPADLTLEKALALINAKAEGPRKLGTDPKSGLIVYAMTGRFGAYVQLGETPEDKKARSRALPRSSRRAWKPRHCDPRGGALRLLSLPARARRPPGDRKAHPCQQGEVRTLRPASDSDSAPSRARTISSTITQDDALELLAEPKQRRGSTATPPSKDLC